MARARNIKPGFFMNDSLSELLPITRLLFIGLWTIADREGRISDRPRKIKAECLPYDDVDCEASLADLHASGFILRYEVGGQRCIQIQNWHKHQTPHHMEVPSDLPSPVGSENRYNHSPLTKQQRERIMRRDKGKCVVCGSSENLHIDHIAPVSEGGTSDDENLRVLCQSCNLSKGNRKSISSRRQVDINSISSGHQHDDSPLIPDSLNLIPDSLIPDSLLPQSDSMKVDAPPIGNAADASQSGTVIDLKAKTETDLQAVCREIWKSYGTAYFERYGTEPVINAKVRSQVKQFAQRIPKAEAPEVASFYVRHCDAFYVRKGHDFGQLLVDAEKLRTEWATGRQITGTKARQTERVSAMYQAVAEIEAEQARGQA